MMLPSYRHRADQHKVIELVAASTLLGQRTALGILVRTSDKMWLTLSCRPVRVCLIAFKGIGTTSVFGLLLLTESL